MGVNHALLYTIGQVYRETKAAQVNYHIFKDILICINFRANLNSQ